MKEIIEEFCEMMEGKLIRHIHYGAVMHKDIMESQEYRALKAIADRPVSKMEVTNQDISRMLEVFNNHIDNGYSQFSSLREALEAVFASMPVSEDKCNHPVMRRCDSCEQPTDTQDNDGWKGYNAPMHLRGAQVELRRFCW